MELHKLRILLVSRRYWPEVIGGGQISAHYIAQALVRSGAEVLVCTFNTDNKRVDEVIDGVRIVRMPIRTLRFFPRFSNLEWMYREMKIQTEKIVKEFQPDVMHALNGESVPSIAAISRKTGIPFVATINGPLLFCFTQEGTDSKGKDCIGCKGWQRFRETMLKWGSGGLLSKLKAFGYWMYSYPHMAVFSRALKSAEQLLPISNGFRNRLVELGYPPEKLVVVHNPLDAHRKVSSSVKRNLKIKPGEKVLFFAGRVTEQKGVQNIIKCLPAVHGAHLIVAGKGDYVDALKQLAQQLGVAGRVHFVGFIPNEQLAPYYSVADVVIMAGTFYEALGRMLMEACSYGVPVIGTKICGTPDVIDDGKNGFLLQTQSVDELAEKIRKILGSSKLAKSMGEFGRKKMIKEFSEKAAAETLMNVYRQAL